ncbi:hypothetical protein KFK09_014351 [Dendrobium nobile]|uniref:Uncharacterized protein n=1 Tax=Dendrobium nobile TaxID=94219 RepID=A0A8T3BCQ3_DENNO|nr:hypothetical protein KFK09_014351 [Dendrobium nobile]
MQDKNQRARYNDMLIIHNITLSLQLGCKCQSSKFIIQDFKSSPCNSRRLATFNMAHSHATIKRVVKIKFLYTTCLQANKDLGVDNEVANINHSQAIQDL